MGGLGVVQVRWAGGSGQLGRVSSQVRRGEGVRKGKFWDRLGGLVLRVGGYLTPSYLSSLSPKPPGPIPSVLLIVVCN